MGYNVQGLLIEVVCEVDYMVTICPSVNMLRLTGVLAVTGDFTGILAMTGVLTH